MSRSWERKRLNERPIYLRSVFMLLAVMQTMCHLGLDYDHISLSLNKAEFNTVSDKDQSAMGKRLPPSAQPLEQLKARVPSTLKMIVLQTVGITASAPILYALFVRNRAWEFSMFFARLFSDVAPVADLSYIPPYHVSLIWRSMTSSFLLLLLWQSSNAIFSAFFAQEPLKRGQPLSAASADPNGTLLDGLMSQKEINKVRSLLSLHSLLKTPITDDHRLSPSGSSSTSAATSTTDENPSSPKYPEPQDQHGLKSKPSASFPSKA